METNYIVAPGVNTSIEKSKTTIPIQSDGTVHIMLIEYIMKNVDKSSLEKVLTDFFYFIRCSKNGVDINIANFVIKNHKRIVKWLNKNEITISFIRKVVETYFNLPENSIDKKTRKREIVVARQIAMYFSKNLTKSSLALIGSLIGCKDHATVLHACKTVNNLCDTDKRFKFQVEEIKKLIKG